MHFSSFFAPVVCVPRKAVAVAQFCAWGLVSCALILCAYSGELRAQSRKPSTQAPSKQAPKPLTKEQAREAERLWARALTNYRVAVENRSDVVVGGNYRSAREDLSKLLSFAPGFAEGYFVRGALWTIAGRFAEAKIDIEEALRLKPKINDKRPQLWFPTMSDSVMFEAFVSFARREFQIATTLFSLMLNARAGANLAAMGTLYLKRAEARLSLWNTKPPGDFSLVREALGDCKSAWKLGETVAAERLYALYAPLLGVQLDFSFPETLQFVPRRRGEDSAVIPLSGAIFRNDNPETARDTVVAVIRRGGDMREELRAPLVYEPYRAEARSAGAAAAKVMPKFRAKFSFQPRIKAECAEYSVELRLRRGVAGETRGEAIAALADTLLAFADSLVAGDVFLFAGQSNMVLGDAPSYPLGEYARTLRFGSDEGRWVRAEDSNVFGEISRVGGVAGETARRIVERFGVPVCILKAALSGTTIEEHLPARRNPPQGIYDNVLAAAKQAGLAAFARGIVWYQGESNGGAGYEEKFGALYRAWNTDYPALERVVVAQIRPHICNELDHAATQESQRHLSALYPKTRLIATNAAEGFDGCHFSQRGYETIAARVFVALVSELYASRAGEKDSLSFAPNLARAYFADSSARAIVCEFLPAASAISLANAADRVEESFALDGRDGKGSVFFGKRGLIARVETNGSNRVILHLKDEVADIRVESVSYGVERPERAQGASEGAIQELQWLVDKRLDEAEGYGGVLSFYRARVGKLQ